MEHRIQTPRAILVPDDLFQMQHFLCTVVFSIEGYLNPLLVNIAAYFHFLEIFDGRHLNTSLFHSLAFQFQER
jgi:hypothetical protein